MSFYMHKRLSNFYFRIRIPQDLQQYFPYLEIKRSLRTKNPKQASGQVRIWSSKAEQVFMTLRSNILAPEQVQDYIRRELPSIWMKSTGDSIGQDQKEGQQKKAKQLRQIMEEYIQEHVTLKKWTEKTRLENESCLVVFREIVGNRPVSSLDRKLLVDFLEKVARLPANMNKKAAYRDKTVLQILDMQGVEPMSSSTVNKYVSRVGALMIYCVRQGYIDRNPAEGLSLVRNVKADEERSAYTRDDLERLMVSLGEIGRDRPERYWVPLIGCYSGARLNEICQLYVSDVVNVDGVHCFDVNDDKDKRLKNLASKRIIPVHPKLIELGFVDYVERLKVKGAVRLWEGLSAGRDGYAHLFGKWYQRHNRKFVTEDKKKCFHSARHTVGDNLKQAGVSEGIIAEILGHSNESITTGRYGKRFRPGVLLEALLKLDY